MAINSQQGNAYNDGHISSEEEDGENYRRADFLPQVNFNDLLNATSYSTSSTKYCEPRVS